MLDWIVRGEQPFAPTPLVPTLCVVTQRVGGSASCAWLRGWLCRKFPTRTQSVPRVIPTQSVGTRRKQGDLGGRSLLLIPMLIVKTRPHVFHILLQRLLPGPHDMAGIRGIFCTVQGGVLGDARGAFVIFRFYGQYGYLLTR